MITRREAAIITSYTGIMLGNFADVQNYTEELFGHPVWTHEFGSPKVWEKLKELSRPDFLTLEVEGLDENGREI
jgi:hypothetical protein